VASETTRARSPIWAALITFVFGLVFAVFAALVPVVGRHLSRALSVMMLAQQGIQPHAPRLPIAAGLAVSVDTRCRCSLGDAVAAGATAGVSERC